jgi:hypothetical protein
MSKPYAEGKMSPEALSIIGKHKGTSSNMMEVDNGDGGQTMNTERKILREALLESNKCQVRDLKLERTI